MRTILYLLLLSTSISLHANETAAPPQPLTTGQSQIFDFDEVPIGRALRILATIARINYVEPELDPKETISLSLTGMTAKEAFFEVARLRGFSIKERNGIVALVRADSSDRAHMVTRRYGVELTPKLQELEPYRDGISELRAKGASFTKITMILRELGIEVTRYAVIRYCEQVLGNWSAPAARGKRVRLAEVRAKRPPYPAVTKRPVSEVSLPDEGRRGPRIADPRTL